MVDIRQESREQAANLGQIARQQGGVIAIAGVADLGNQRRRSIVGERRHRQAGALAQPVDEVVEFGRLLARELRL